MCNGCVIGYSDWFRIVTHALISRLSMNFSKTLLIISRSMHFVSSAMISYHRHCLQKPYTYITRASFMEWSSESIHSKRIFLRTRRSKTIVAHTTTLSARLSHVGAYRIRNKGSSDFINHHFNRTR